MNVSVNLSVNSQQTLEEPLYIAYVITFGINGNCILEKLVVNASIDDIQGNNNIMNTYNIAMYLLASFINTSVNYSDLIIYVTHGIINCTRYYDWITNV